MAGKFHLVFADWKSRPGRNEGWREERRMSFPTEDYFRREYPETLEDVLLAPEDTVFPGWAIEQCLAVYPFPVTAIVGRPQHRYIKMWDIGRMQDAAVGVCLDITRAPYILCDYKRLVKQPYQVLQVAIAEFHKRYPGITYIEDNNAGQAVRENLTVPASPFLTTGASKPRAIMALKVFLEQGYLQMKEIPQLIFELQSYMWDDKALVQDSVMALAICCFLAGPPIHHMERPTIKQTQGRTLSTATPGGRRAVSRIATGSSTGRRSARASEGNGQMADDYVR